MFIHLTTKYLLVVLLHRFVLVVLGYQMFPDSQQCEQVKFDIYGGQCYDVKSEKLQYCSKVSYQLLYRFSQDENFVTSDKGLKRQEFCLTRTSVSIELLKHDFKQISTCIYMGLFS